jgi:integrase
MTQTGRVLPLATGNLKHQTALSVAYGTGLRASEVVALKVGDVDSQRMTLSIEQGKGRRDRYRIQTRWGEGHSYHDPEVSTPNLRAWFKQMIQKYPSMRRNRYLKMTRVLQTIALVGKSSTRHSRGL